MTRERLFSRRLSTSFDFQSGNLNFTCTYSRFTDGRLAEVFLQNHKPGSQSDVNAREAAISASLALQHGCPFETLRHAMLREEDGRASGPLGMGLDLIAAEKP
jgi:hypothetical protein